MKNPSCCALICLYLFLVSGFGETGSLYAQDKRLLEGELIIDCSAFLDSITIDIEAHAFDSYCTWYSLNSSLDHWSDYNTDYACLKFVDRELGPCPHEVNPPLFG